MTPSIRCTLTLACAAVVAAGDTPPAPRPHVLIILADDLGYGDVGFHGCKDIPTPNLDRLAASGVRCTDAYVSAPQCSPSRAGLLTGRLQQRFGYECNADDTPELGLPANQPTIAERLSAAGYATGGFGKWHLGSAPALRPTARGFGTWWGFWGGGRNFTPGNGKDSQVHQLRLGEEPVAWKGHLTDAIADAAIGFMTTKRETPWFCYLSFNAPHTPLQPDAASVRAVAGIGDKLRRDYAGLVVGMDRAIGRVLDALASSGQERDTLVVFLSDNGGPDGVTHSSNRPLRGVKGNLYEGGIRVPFVVRYPAALKPGVCSTPVWSLDLAATALAVAGAPADPQADGVDLRPILGGAPGPERALFFRWDFWHYGVPAAEVQGHNAALRRGNLKLVWPGRPHAAQPPQLYDLAADIGETNDLAASRPETVAELTALWTTLNQPMQPPAWESAGSKSKKPKH